MHHPPLTDDAPCRCDWHLSVDNLRIVRYALADLRCLDEAPARTLNLLRQLEQRLVDRVSQTP